MKLLVTLYAYNEAHRIEPVLDKLREAQKKYNFDVVIADDGSTDKTREIANNYVKKYDWNIVSHKQNEGIGSMIRDVIKYARRHNYDVLTGMPGNGKVLPEELHVMYEPVINGEFDYVKGSRYIKGAEYYNLPLFRKLAIPVFSFFISVLMFRKITDVTCLINALNLKIFDDKKINLDQDWLNKYELEYYILYYVLKTKKRFKEVPMTCNYPTEKKNYSKIKPFSGWWSMIRPWILLKLRIKK